MTPEWTFVDVPVTERLDDPVHGWTFHALEALDRACRVDMHDSDDETRTAKEFFVRRANDTEAHCHWILAMEGEDPIGAAMIDLPVRADRDKALFSVGVRPDARRAGVASALMNQCEAIARQAGRRLAVVEAGYGAIEDHAPYLHACAGSQAPEQAGYVGFLHHRGYVLAHAARRSTLRLPLPTGLEDRLMAESVPFTHGYRLHTWINEIPSDWVEPYARLREAFSRDAPMGDVAWEEEVWDRARVERRVEDLTSQGKHFAMTAVEHLETGDLVGYTELRWEVAEPCEWSDQWITIVLGPHRGHRLGMWMKLVNLEAMTARRPEISRVHTDNAQENAPMLDINIAMGFRPDGGIATMRKSLA
ncbi:MAG: GNAT family N-acetyltransferase [Propionibacteriaceae bacterium]|nr:GNAT family N-acetyltransferase [Propionibacteriaceae bacterium]